MIVVTVEFSIHPPHEREFQEIVLMQAHNSLTHEADCHRFDVSIDPHDGTRFFLYEVYTDDAALQAHRKTSHYHEFGTRAAAWVAQKRVQVWHGLDPA
ncbi:MAG: antibiotic biosynthesis monooxygenase [Desulfobacterales bacterium]